MNIEETIDKYLNEAKKAKTISSNMQDVVASLLTVSNFGMNVSLKDDYVKIEQNKIPMSKLSKSSLKQQYYNWYSEDDDSFEDEYKHWLKTTKKDSIDKILGYVSPNIREIIELLVSKGK